VPLMAILYVNTSLPSETTSARTSATVADGETMDYKLLYEICLRNCSNSGSYEGCKLWPHPTQPSSYSSSSSSKKPTSSMYGGGGGGGGFGMISSEEEDSEEEDDDDDDDEEDMNKTEQDATSSSTGCFFPIHMIGVPNLPRNAKVEFEVIGMNNELQHKFRDCNQPLTHYQVSFIPTIRPVVAFKGERTIPSSHTNVVEERQMKHPPWLPYPLPTASTTSSSTSSTSSGSSSSSSSSSSSYSDNKKELSDLMTHVDVSCLTSSLRLGFVSVTSATSLFSYPTSTSTTSLFDVCSGIVCGIESVLNFKSLPNHNSMGAWSLAHVRIFFVPPPPPPLPSDNKTNEASAAVIEEEGEEDSWNILTITKRLTSLLSSSSLQAYQPALTIVPVSSLPHMINNPLQVETTTTTTTNSNNNINSATTTTTTTSNASLRVSGTNNNKFALMVAQIHVVDSLKLDTDRWILECD
jgi:hypothetical protein